MSKPPPPTSPDTPKKPYHLRKLRRGVTLNFNGYDHDGIPQWLLYDPARNNFFTIGWPEYEMLSRWHLGDPKIIIDAVNKETTVKVTLEDFESLLGFLNKNYLVEQRWRNVFQKAKEQKVIKGENLLYWFIRYYLFFRVPLFHPDKFLNKTAWFGRLLFNRYTAYVMIVLGMMAIYQVGQQWQEFTHTFSSIFSWQGLFFYLIAFTVAKFFHELGHAYMCRRFGVSVPTMGVAFLVFWPILYTDTTLSWSLPSYQRLRIAIAGMWVETYITIIAALVWANVHNLVIQMICYVTVAINWVSTLLINVSPFMRFDGYYVLSDLLKIPNLQQRSFALARWQIRNWLFGWEEPLDEQFSEKMHWILVSYAIITWVYRLFIYLGIAILVYHYFFKVVGIILFGIELFAFILRPVVHELKLWYDLRKQFVLNKNLKLTLVASFCFLLFLFLPLNSGIKLNATLSYSHEFLYSPQNAVLQNNLPPSGTLVKANETILVLKSPEIERDLLKTRWEYEKISIEIRRASLNEKYSNQTSSLIAALSEKKAQYEKLLDLQSKLIIKAPFDGIVGDVATDLRPGLTVMKDQWIADIINPNQLVVEAFAEEIDLNELKIGTKGYFYPVNISDSSIPVIISAMEPTNTTLLNPHFTKEVKQNGNKDIIVDTPSYHASDLGGKIAVNVSDKGEYNPIDSVYRILLIPEKPDKNLQIVRVQMGTVILTVAPRSYFYRVTYKLKKILIQESGF